MSSRSLLFTRGRFFLVFHQFPERLFFCPPDFPLFLRLSMFYLNTLFPPAPASPRPSSPSRLSGVLDFLLPGGRGSSFFAFFSFFLLPRCSPLLGGSFSSIAPWTFFFFCLPFCAKGRGRPLVSDSSGLQGDETWSSFRRWSGAPAVPRGMRFGPSWFPPRCFAAPFPGPGRVLVPSCFRGRRLLFFLFDTQREDFSLQ